MSFYLTLPSNSSLNYYPENTLANYKTKLPQLFDLEGEWEVGLAEMQFPITWYNLSESEAHLYLLGKEVGGKGKGYPWVDVSPPAGYYENPEALVKQINTALISLDLNSPLDLKKVSGTRFVYNEISKKITMEFRKNHSYLQVLMSKTLVELMGFDWENSGKWTPYVRDYITYVTDSNPDEEDTNVHIDPATLSFSEPTTVPLENKDLVKYYVKGDSYQAERVCDLQRGFYSLYVYCDICESVVVGEYKVPLLRTVNLNGKDGGMVSRIYQTIQYVPIQRKQFDTLEIDIRNDAGEKVAFQRGKVIVTLHCRLRKPSYF